MLSNAVGKMNPWYIMLGVGLILLLALAVDFVWQKWTQITKSIAALEAGHKKQSEEAVKTIRDYSSQIAKLQADRQKADQELNDRLEQQFRSLFEDVVKTRDLIKKETEERAASDINDRNRLTAVELRVGKVEARVPERR